MNWPPGNLGSVFGDFPLLSNLHADTLADNERHIIARCAFVGLVLKDPRVEALYQSWRERLGFPAAKAAMEPARAIIFKRTGLSFADGLRAGTILLTAEERRGIDCAFQLWDQVLGRSREIDMAAASADLVKEMGLTWGWLAAEIAVTFMVDLLACLDGQPMGRTLWAEPEVALAYPAELHFTVGEDETFEQAAARLGSAVQGFLESIRPNPFEALPVGKRISDDDEARIMRDIDWFYQARVKAPRVPIFRLAAQVFAKDEAASRRRSIYDGIESARKLLSYGEGTLP